VTHGWTGNSVLCSLDDGAVEWVDRPGLRRDFLGGRGYGVALMAEFGFPARPVLESAQPFILSAGPLTGTAAPSSGRFAAVGLSPLTGTIFDGNAGGRFGVRLRQAGLDALVLLGCCPEWSVVVIDGRRGRGAPTAVRVVPLRDVWPEIDPLDSGLTSLRTVEGLRAGLGPGFSMVFPSVAGRRGALLGSLRTDDRRSFGRGGLGAVLSAKRVFAVAVAGDRDLDVADRGRLEFLVYEAEKQLAANPVTSRALPEFGTAVLMRIVHQAGALPALNYRTTMWDGVDAICGEAMRDQMTRGRQGCFGCRIRCTRRVNTGEGPEYETLWAFGADCGVADLETIQEANRLCAEFGLDTISLGATIACAMELGEAGVLGRALGFGDGARLLELVLQAGVGRGFGAELADGSARFAARYGHPESAMHVKGLELPAYDPRAMHGQGLAYATSNRGACHLRGNMLGPELLGIPKLVDRFEDRGKSGVLVTLQHQAAVFDSACLCMFAGFAFGDELLSRMLGAATGESISERDTQEIGERIWNLERVWNLAAGFSARDDTLPRRILDEPHSEGPAAGRAIDLPAMLDEYYRARGWTAEGVPAPAKVRMLGLEEQAARLHTLSAAADGPSTDGRRPGDPRGEAPRGDHRQREGRHLRAV